jgi:hypothetical protein
MNYEDTPITKWFKIKNKDYVISPKYFHYDGNHIQFLIERPKKYYYIGSIKWKDYDTTLNICCTKKIYNKANKNNQTFMEFVNFANNNFNTSQIPILKSNLQKCIRRSLVEEAKSSALTILCLKPSELLRRLPIIVLEDVMLNSNFLFLVWLMCAESKGFPINDEYMKKIIIVVEHLASFENRDLCYKKENINIRKLDLTKISDYEKDILWSIQLRKSYGGMKGDMKMLNYFTQNWYDRFKNGYELSGSNYDIDINNLRLIRYNDIQLAAIDFHCTNIITFITNKYPKYDKEKIKKAIWFHRSCYNNKNINKGNENLSKDYEKIWNNIHRYVDFSSKIILKNTF